MRERGKALVSACVINAILMALMPRSGCEAGTGCDLQSVEVDDRYLVRVGGERVELREGGDDGDGHGGAGRVEQVQRDEEEEGRNKRAGQVAPSFASCLHPTQLTMHGTVWLHLGILSLLPAQSYAVSWIGNPKRGHIPSEPHQSVVEIAGSEGAGEVQGECMCTIPRSVRAHESVSATQQ